MNSPCAPKQPKVRSLNPKQQQRNDETKLDIQCQPSLLLLFASEAQKFPPQSATRRTHPFDTGLFVQSHRSTVLRMMTPHPLLRRSVFLTLAPIRLFTAQGRARLEESNSHCFVQGRTELIHSSSWIEFRGSTDVCPLGSPNSQLFKMSCFPLIVQIGSELVRAGHTRREVGEISCGEHGRHPTSHL